MEKINVTNVGYVSPDEIYIPEWRLYTQYVDKDAVPMIYCKRFTQYGLEPLLIGDCHSTHSDIEQDALTIIGNRELERDDVFQDDCCYLRIFANADIITSWGDDEYTKEILSDVINCLKQGTYVCFNRKYETEEQYYSDNYDISQTKELPIYINIDNLQYYWEGYEDENGEDVKYVYRAPVSELMHSDIQINKADDSEQRLFHLMSPQEKAEYLKNNDEKRQERINYFKEGEKSWDEKHPGWDPAQYHMTFYQEGKTMKIGEQDIRKMVTETIKRLLKEDNTANLTLSEFTYCVEKLNRLTYKLQEANNELLSCAKEIIEGLPHYGITIENVSNELTNTGLMLKGNISITNPNDVDPEEYDLNNSFDYKEFIRNNLEELFNDIKNWKRLRYVEGIYYIDNGILLEMDEYNPINISSKLPDV